MEDIIKAVLKIVGVIVLIVCMILICNKCDRDKWNDGHCSVCGSQWRFVQAVGHRHSTTYIYACDKCGNSIEVSIAPNWAESTATEANNE